MKNTLTPSLTERRLVSLLGVILLTLVIWGIMANHLFQVAYILGALALALGTTLLLATWKHGFRWFFTRRAMRFNAWLLVGLISVVVFFYTEESWRGKRAWAALQREAAARGESLALASIIPPAVPEEQNFAQAPGMASVLGYDPSQPEGAHRRLPFYHGTSEQWPPANWAVQQPTDLAAWQQFFRRHPAPASSEANEAVDQLDLPTAAQPQNPAADVVLALSRFETNLAILRSASPRPATRFPLDYTQGYWALNASYKLPAENLYSATHILSLRASAELALNQPEAALEDIRLALRLVDALRQEPFYLAHDYRAQMFMFCLQPIWEGLANQRWSAPQLAVLQDRLGALDWRADFRQPARGESLLLMDLADQFQAFLEDQPSPLNQQIVGTEPDDRFALWLAGALYPTGWLYQDKVWTYRIYQQYDSPLQALSHRKAAPSERNSTLRRISDPMFLVLVYPRLRHVFDDLSKKALFLDTACQQAKAACALERYRLAQGRYPDSLEALVPAYLSQIPRDTLDPSGSPLRYCRTDNDGFQLYSVGWNQIDDHGQPAPADKSWRGTQHLFPRLTQGDWAWRQF